jgi:uncharacterized repeat protein (TIGR01451 family)
LTPFGFRDTHSPNLKSVTHVLDEYSDLTPSTDLRQAPSARSNPMTCSSYSFRFFCAAVLVVAVLTLGGSRADGASPCKGDGQECRTSQSCCSGVCVGSAPPGKRAKGTCCTPTTCAAAGANCDFIVDGNCPDTLFCGTCTAPEVCGGAGTPNVCATPPLSILKTVAGSDMIRPGDAAAFTIAVSNVSGLPVSNVIMTDQLPDADALTWQITSSTFSAASLSAGDVLTATMPTLPAGATISLTVTALVPFDVGALPLALINTAALQADGMPSITSGEATITVDGTPRLSIVKVIASQDMISPGDTASFTISVSNATALPATNVTVTDQLPAADLLTWGVTSSTFDVASLNTTDLLTAASATLPRGATVSITVSAIIPIDITPLPLSLPNTATLHADGITAITTDDVVITVDTGP